jgi:hypothetical protein
MTRYIVKLPAIPNAFVWHGIVRRIHVTAPRPTGWEVHGFSDSWRDIVPSRRGECERRLTGETRNERNERLILWRRIGGKDYRRSTAPRFIRVGDVNRLTIRRQ